MGLHCIQCQVHNNHSFITHSTKIAHVLSHGWLFVTPWTAACKASLSIKNFWSLLKLSSTESVMPFNHLILCYSLLLLPSIFFSIRVLSNELALHIRWPKYWNFSFSFSICPSNDYSGLISFRMNCFDLLAAQGTWESSLTPQAFSNTTVKNHQFFWHAAFFMVQLSHPYMTAGKTHNFD